MHSLITSVTILILAAIAQSHVSEAVDGWRPLAKISPAGR
jgi:hypothetical protein